MNQQLTVKKFLLARWLQRLAVCLVWTYSFTICFSQASSFSQSDVAVKPLTQKIYAQELQQLALTYAKEFLSQSHAGGRIEYRAAKVDARLSMTRCSTPLVFDSPKSNARAGRKIVKVSCQDHKPWSVFIPLTFTYWQQVVTAKYAISRNTVISADDIEITEQALRYQAADYLSDIRQVIGQSAKRTIVAGQAISQQSLKPARWIKRGDQVSIISSTPRIEIKMAGMAMTDGSQGQQISVRNKSSKRIIKAVVVAPGEVRPVL